MPAAPDPEALDAAALAQRVAVLDQIVDADERVASRVRQLNWRGARKTAFIRVDEDGHWSAIASGAHQQGRGFVALVAWLAQIPADQAAEFLSAILSSVRVLA